MARLQPERPDPVLDWTAEETGRPALRRSALPRRADTFATHIAFDSEYYLSIAAVGYDDPRGHAVRGSRWRRAAQLRLHAGLPVRHASRGRPAHLARHGPASHGRRDCGRGRVPGSDARRHARALQPGPPPPCRWRAPSARRSTCSSSRRASSWPRCTARPSSWRLSFGALAPSRIDARCWRAALPSSRCLTRPVGIALVLPIGVGLALLVLLWHRRRARGERRGARSRAPSWSAGSWPYLRRC